MTIRIESVTPYLCARDAAAALDFYKTVFGAEELFRLTDPGDGRIGHAEFRIGETLMFLADEYPDIYGGHGAREVGTLARTHHLVTDQVKVDGRNRPGIRWPVLTEAAADRTLEEDNEEDIDDAA